MIVDAATCDVLAIADKVLLDDDGDPSNEKDRVDFAWSNELALHVLELKTGGPVMDVSTLALGFRDEVEAANMALLPLGAKLMPTAMHPWMNPEKEMKLWPHGDQDIYNTFHRIFDCRGHGWSNLQSTHINIGFETEEEFAKLHTAIRLVLPLLPALAASSPFVEGKFAKMLDYRIETYRKNCRRFPSVTGSVIPENAFSEKQYQKEILEPIYNDMSEVDPEGELAYEWINARGAIARFDRDTIEIRLLDCQECPQSDLAIVQFVLAILDELVGGRWSDVAQQSQLSATELEALLMDVARNGEQAKLTSASYKACFGIAEDGAMNVGELLGELFEIVSAGRNEPWHDTIRFILQEGCLARRILRRIGEEPTAESLKAIYAELTLCLAENRLLQAPRA